MKRIVSILIILSGAAICHANVSRPVFFAESNDIYAPVGIQLQFSGRIEPPVSAQSCLAAAELTIGAAVVNSVSTNRDYTLNLQCSKTLSVLYRIRGVLPNGNRFIVSKGSLQIGELGRTLVSVGQITFPNPTQCRIILAGSVKPETAHLFILDPHEAVPSRVADRYDPESKVLTADISALVVGTYRVWIVAYDSDSQYISPEAELQIGDKIKVVPEAGTEWLVGATNKHSAIKLTTYGIPPCDIELWLGNKLVGRLNGVNASASLAVDISMFTSGTYALKATTNVDNIVFSSSPVTVTITNQERDDQIAADAKDAGRESVVASARRLYKVLYDHKGRVGQIRGLSVVTINDRPVWGEPLPITLLITPATGKHGEFFFNTKTDPYTNKSVMNALVFAKKHLAKQGITYNIWDYDYHLSFDVDCAVGGDSAGAAIATSVISQLTHTPIRSEVAVTGAIDAEGNILEVGGYLYKSIAALADPEVLTLIIPATKKALNETLLLPPEFVAGHRIICASDMEQILRQALVGYDQRADAADKAMQSALNCFAAGNIVECSNQLRTVYEMTPEDLSYKFWWQLIFSGGWK